MDIELTFKNPLVILHGEVAGEIWSAIFTFQAGDFQCKGEHMSATMQVGSYASVSVEWKDKGGNIVKVDGPTKWESSAPDIVQCTVSTGNPQIANLYAPSGIGTAQIHATADADLGEGTKAVTSTLDVQVISGEAVSGDITFTPTGTGPETATGPGTATGGAAPASRRH